MEFFHLSANDIVLRMSGSALHAGLISLSNNDQLKVKSHGKGLELHSFSKHRPGPSVCLIHSNPQSFIHLKFVFILVNIAKVLLVVKTLIRSAAALFSSHETIKQQPN